MIIEVYDKRGQKDAFGALTRLGKVETKLHIKTTITSLSQTKKKLNLDTLISNVKVKHFSIWHIHHLKLKKRFFARQT